MEEQIAEIYTGINTKKTTPIVFDAFNERYYQKYKSNNWLKLHGKTMRRKPFKRESQENFFILGTVGRGMHFRSKLQMLDEGNEYERLN